ncbi:MAG: phenylacetate--CoA ligase family protein [Gammaproteobacteria bacterium]|nr:phenylacetate--CoA ligase family protein [Gammaproteobacteria bacterium]
MTLALLHQFEQSQWLDSQHIRMLQIQQLDGLLAHAFETVPRYRQQWAGVYHRKRPLTYDTVLQLPYVSRVTLQSEFEAFKSAKVPSSHGKVQEGRTSGSTAAPVRFLTTQLSGVYWNALTLRDHLWHRRDLNQTLAVIRRESSPGRYAGWGSATHGIVKTGPSVGNTIGADANELLDWLASENPGYLLTYPSLVAEIARLAIARGVPLPNLREIRTLAESVNEETRALCRLAWGVPITDLYSASEAGYLALQCPDHEHYHVMAESSLVEVLDDSGTPCEPGQVGRVVVTPLHSFAMPLIRYDIGDYGEVGEACPCGRGLPVLRRILGRVRNTLITADGKRYWPAFGTRALMEVAPVTQYQFVQTAADVVEARLVAPGGLTATQEGLFRERVMSKLPKGIEVADRLSREDSTQCQRQVRRVHFRSRARAVAHLTLAAGRRARSRIPAALRNPLRVRPHAPDSADNQTARCACEFAHDPAPASAPRAYAAVKSTP